MFKVGDRVVFSLAGDNQPFLKDNIGVIIGKRTDLYSILHLNKYNKSIYHNVISNKIDSLENIESARDEINKYYDKKIEEWKENLIILTQDTKDAERLEKYENLKQQIKTTSKNLYESKDNLDFENKLKAISRLKTQIFSIELDCIPDTRKQNGGVWYEIRELNKVRDGRLKRISDEEIKDIFRELLL